MLVACDKAISDQSKHAIHRFCYKPIELDICGKIHAAFTSIIYKSNAWYSTISRFRKGDPEYDELFAIKSSYNGGETIGEILTGYGPMHTYKYIIFSFLTM